MSLGIHSLPRENQDELSKGKSMARRRLQEGSVFKRGTRKKVWVARWRDWVRTEDGSLKRVMRSEILGPVSELTKSDAKEKLRQKLGANQSKKDIEADVTFKVFVERWWKPASLPTYKVSTRLQAFRNLATSGFPISKNQIFKLSWGGCSIGSHRTRCMGFTGTFGESSPVPRNGATSPTIRREASVCRQLGDGSRRLSCRNSFDGSVKPSPRKCG